MYKKIRAYIGSTLFVLALCVGVYLAIQWQKTRVELERTQREASGVENYLLEKVSQTQKELDTTRADLASLQSDYEKLQSELAENQAAKQEVEARANLYQEQKYYLADVLDWVGRSLGYSDIETSVRVYGQNYGRQAPQSCEIMPPERYLKWASTTSTFFVVSPEKMGWTRYTSIRENVTFGPDHSNEEGYLGSRGYEWRYPLVPGSYPLQEIHTTLNVFDSELDPGKYAPGKSILDEVELNCGVTGYITQSNDPDETKQITFTIGSYTGNVKLKYDYEDISTVVPILTQAANVVIDDLTSGW